VPAHRFVSAWFVLAQFLSTVAQPASTSSLPFNSTMAQFLSTLGQNRKKNFAGDFEIWFKENLNSN
jgi:hypothetical protein